MFFELGGKDSFRFPKAAFCHKLGRELKKLRHESDLSGLGLMVWETNYSL